MGQHLDENGLEKIRVEILKVHGDNYSGSIMTASPGGLLNGQQLEEKDDDGDPFGLGESPLG